MAQPAPARSGSSTRHHTSSANSDSRRVVEDDVAATAEFLNTLSLDESIEHLVVVSDPRDPGEMREHFRRDLRGKIIGKFARTSAGGGLGTSPH